MDSAMVVVRWGLIALVVMVVVGFVGYRIASASDTAPAVGTQAPAFTLPSQTGASVSLSDFKGKWVVLYFYPKDFTSGCTTEEIGRASCRERV